MFLSYVLSFIYVGIYWNNHHHLVAGLVSPMLGFAVFVGVALAWLVPDRRMERALAQPRQPSA